MEFRGTRAGGLSRPDNTFRLKGETELDFYAEVLKMVSFSLC